MQDIQKVELTCGCTYSTSAKVWHLCKMHMRLPAKRPVPDDKFVIAETLIKRQNNQGFLPEDYLLAEKYVEGGGHLPTTIGMKEERVNDTPGIKPTSNNSPQMNISIAKPLSNERQLSFNDAPRANEAVQPPHEVTAMPEVSKSKKRKRKIPQNVRSYCLARDDYSCQYPGCKLSKSDGAVLNLHHIHHEQFGGEEVPSNLVTLCDIHHKAMHIEFSAYYADSTSVLNRMNDMFKRLLSQLRLLVNVDDAYDLKPYLHFLTNADDFRAGQLPAIRAALRGQSVLLVTPTGTGKSICYQLPGMLASSPTLVISPLKALMVDQVRSIWSKMIPATYINSDLSVEEKKRRFEFIGRHLYKFIFVAPERFFKSSSTESEKLILEYSYLVIDEAHAIDAWGIAFRPSYRKLGDLRSRLSNPPTIALTATASRHTQAVILQSLGLVDAKVIVTGFFKKNIEIKKYVASNPADKLSYLTELLQNNYGTKTLIFVPTIKEGSSLLSKLIEKGHAAEFYHGQLASKTKMDIQSRYTSLSKPGLNILISTSAFGMGIDIPDIQLVIHWYPALSLTEYTQQIGRAGRDGRNAEAHLLYEQGDEKLLKFLSTQVTKSPTFKVKNDYTDSDVTRVESILQQELENMIYLTSVEDGLEWRTILDYFGETPIQFWSRYGKTIFDLSLLLSCLGLLAFILSTLISA